MINLLSPIVGKRSLENPKVSLGDPVAWQELFGDGLSSTGVTVNNRTAMQYAAIWRGVTLVSRDVARMPAFVYKKNPAGGKDKAISHPAFSLLRYKANPHVTAYTLKQTAHMWFMLSGNGYILIERDNRGAAKALWNLPSTGVSPIVELGEGGSQMLDRYMVNIKGFMTFVRPSDMIHIKGISENGIEGLSMVEHAAESIGLGVAARKYNAIFFKNAANGRVVIECPVEMNPEMAAKIRNQWERLYTGLDNAHRTVVLDQGMKVNQLSHTAKDAQLNELREFEIREIANYIGVPAHKLGDTTRTSFKSLEEENKSYLDDIDGQIVCWEMELRDKLLTDQQKRSDSHAIEFNRDALVQINFTSKIDGMVKQANNGLKTLNEIRAMQNDPPYTPEIGDVPFGPVNLAPLNQRQPAPSSPSKNDQEKSRVAVDIAVDAFRRMEGRVADRIMRAVKKPDKFESWAIDGLNKLRGSSIEIMRSPMLLLGRDAAEIVDRYLEDLTETVQDASSAPADKLAEVVSRALSQLSERWKVGVICPNEDSFPNN